ncbi:MAG: hypothetical protein FD174_723 [Geobacteraceae bacterium]|nr:MAG: hypothetical protein FD174_723 [Geobacteraceae bacterium]
MVGLLVMLELAALLLVAYPVIADTGPYGGKDGAALAVSQERGADGPRRGHAGAAGEERTGEREKRFIIRTLDDFKGSLSLAEDEIQELEKEIDAITLLESLQREKDFTNFLDWYHGYADWLKDVIGDFEDDLALFPAGPSRGEERWMGRFGGMVKKQHALARELEKRVKRYDAEEKRLAGIIERRRELRERFGELHDSLARIEDRIRESQGSSSERRENEKKAEKFRADIRVVQNELLSLPLVDEDILKHYAVLVERGEAEIDWLSLKRDEYEAMRDVAAVVGRDPRRDASAIEAAYRRVVRVLESAINRLFRKMDELDRKRARVTPAGSLREVERSRELAGFYERLQGRYDGEIRRLRVLIGAYDAELAEVLSERGR